jgi:hypothetical protein
MFTTAVIDFARAYSVRSKRSVYKAMRAPNLHADSFLPRHGLTAGEFGVGYIIAQKANDATPPVQAKRRRLVLEPLPAPKHKIRKEVDSAHVAIEVSSNHVVHSRSDGHHKTSSSQVTQEEKETIKESTSATNVADVEAALKTPPAVLRRSTRARGHTKS